jgi:hypothetical protein
MKAALYFDSAEGFGQWRILISGKANRNLRETKKKDPNLFRITLKKIKYPFLSLVSLCMMSNSSLLPIESYRMVISLTTIKSA